MIRVAFGGVAALTALLLVWQWLLAGALPEAFAPARATVRTLDLEELRGAASDAATLARTASRLVEEQLLAVAPFEEAMEAAPTPASPAAPRAPEMEPSGERVAEPAADAVSEPAAEPTTERRTELDDGVDAALIRRMLAVYALTGMRE